MSSMHELLPIVQTAIGPVILISGVGLLLLSMTNRFSRVIDRARNLLAISERTSGPVRARAVAQLEILWKQARLIRLAILLASVSVLLAACLIILIFVTALFRLENAWFVSLVFAACLLSLIASLTVFITDINRSLAALKLELFGHRPDDHSPKGVEGPADGRQSG